MRIETAAPLPSYPTYDKRTKVPGVGESGSQEDGPQMRPATTGANPLDGIFDQLSRVLEDHQEQPPPVDEVEPDSPVDDLAAALQRAGSGSEQVGSLLDRVDHFGDSRLFFQAVNRDVYLSTANSVEAHGGNLTDLMQTAQRVVGSGGNIDHFMAMVDKVMAEADYDDLHRFFEVTNSVVDNGQDLEQYYAFGRRLLDEHPSDFETGIFDAETFMDYGGRIQDFVAIADNLGLTGFEGRNNSVDFHRVLVDVRDHGGSIPIFFRQMAEKAGNGQSLRQYLDDYLDTYGLVSTRPDPSQFSQLRRIDNDPMDVIEGENAALFAQAISSRDGLLPPTVLYWSSDETGAMGQGNTLDLSHLQPGTYHIAVKIGDYPGTDTAKQTVVVKARDPDVPLPAPAVPPTPQAPAPPPEPVMTAQDRAELFAGGRWCVYPTFDWAGLQLPVRLPEYFPSVPFAPGSFDAASVEYGEEMAFAVFDDGLTHTEAFFWRRQLSISLLLSEQVFDAWIKAYQDELEKEQEEIRRLEKLGHRWADQLLQRLATLPVSNPLVPESVATPADGQAVAPPIPPVEATTS